MAIAADIKQTLAQLIEDNYSLREAVKSTNPELLENTKVEDEKIRQMLENGEEAEDIVKELTILPQGADTEQENEQLNQAILDIQQQNNKMHENLNKTLRAKERAEEEARELKRELKELEKQAKFQELEPISNRYNNISPSVSGSHLKVQETEKMEHSQHRSRYLKAEQSDLYTSGRVLDNQIDFKIFYELQQKSPGFAAMIGRYPFIKEDIMFPNFVKSIRNGENVVFAIADGKVVPIMNENYCISPDLVVTENVIFKDNVEMRDAVLFAKYHNKCQFISLKGCSFAEVIIEADNCTEEIVFVLNKRLKRVDCTACTLIKRIICDVSNERLLKKFVGARPDVKIGYRGGMGEWDDVELQIVL